MNIIPGLVCNLHDELVLLLEAVVQDSEIDGGAHVVNVGHKDKLPAVGQQLVHQLGVVERLVKVAVAGRIPPEQYLLKQSVMNMIIKEMLPVDSGISFEIFGDGQE